MAIGNDGIGGSGDRRVGGGSLDRPRGVTSPATPSLGGPRQQRGRTGRDPYDLQTAFSRLKRLLRLDGSAGPKQGIPNRGYYLNVLV